MEQTILRASTHPYPRAGWCLFCGARSLLALSAIALGPENPVGVLAARSAIALSRVSRTDCRQIETS